MHRVTGREPWRPFAPLVLAEKAGDWFTRCPIQSPYMLLTAKVRGDKLPAITHVDGSSRIQTVDESCGGVRRTDCQDPGGSNRLPDEFGDRRVLYQRPPHHPRRVLFLKTAQGLVDISLRFASLHGLGDGIDALQDAILQRHALPIPHQRLLGANTDRPIREDFLD